MKNRKKLVSILAGIMAAVLVLTLIMSLLPTRAYAASSSEIRKQITGLQEQRTEMKSKMKELESQYQENKDEISNIVAKKNLIDQEMTLLHAQVDNINEQITAYGVLVADKQDELDAAQENYNTLNEEYKTRIRTMEEEGTLSYWEVLFKANSFSDLLDRMSMIEEIAASDTRRLEALDEATKAVEQARQELETEKADLESTKEELDATQAELDAKREEADGVIAELLEKAEEIEGLQEELESEDQDLLKQIAQMEKEYTAAKHQEWLAYMATYTTVPPATTAPASSGGSSGGSKRGGSSASEDVYAGMYKAGIRSEGDAYAWLLSAGYNTTQAGKLAGYYADWMKNQGGSGNSGSDAQIGNRHGDSWIYIPGHGRFTYDEVENYVNSGKVIETYDSATNTYTYKWNGNKK